MRITMLALATLLTFALTVPTWAADEPLGLALEGYDYPYPVAYFPLRIEDQDVRMAYMEVAPTGRPNGKTVVLFHGKNFFGAYWRDTIAFLSANGYRVVAPDQLGFGKSSKPGIYYSFHLLADSTKQLLDSLGVRQAAVVGHSMGGMVAARFALQYPQFTTALVLENPIGLEDYKLHVPFTSQADLYAGELKRTLEATRKYHETYYVEWKPEYEEWVQVHHRWSLGAEFPRLAWVNALTTQMVYTQPVLYEFPRIAVPTLVVIGQEDRTAIGKDKVAPEVARTLGNYPELGRRTAAAIPGAKLVELENVGHVPHFEARERFHSELLTWLGVGE